MQIAALLVATLAFAACAPSGNQECSSDSGCPAAQHCVTNECLPIPAPPPLVGVAITLVTAEDEAITSQLLAKGGDGGLVAFYLDGPSRTPLGDTSLDDNTLTFTPDTEASGHEQRNIFPAQNGVLGEPATIDITVSTVNDGPRLTVVGPFDDTNGDAIRFYASTTDRENDDITFTASFAGAGDVSVHPSDPGIVTIEYAPADDVTGDVTGTITASDSSDADVSTVANVTVTLP